MTLDDLAQGEHWMTLDERQNAAELVQSLRQIIAGRPIPENYPLVHCAREFILHHTLCQRLENELIPDPAAARPTIEPALAGYIARLHDRVRRILKEFQDTADKLDPTKPARDTRRDGNHAGKKTPCPTATPPADGEAPTDSDHKRYWDQDLIDEVGIDLNDPDFFPDEPSFYSLPIDVQFRLRPHSFPPQVRTRLGLPLTDPEPFPDPEAAYKEAMDAYLASGEEDELQAPAAARDASTQQPTPVPRQDIESNPSAGSNPPLSSYPPHCQRSTINRQLTPTPSTPPHSCTPSHHPYPSSASHQSRMPPTSHFSHPSPPNANQPTPAQTPESGLPRPKTQDPNPSPKPWRSPIPPTPPPVVKYYKVKPTPFNQRQFKKSSPT